MSDDQSDNDGDYAPVHRRVDYRRSVLQIPQDSSVVEMPETTTLENLDFAKVDFELILQCMQEGLCNFLGFSKLRRTFLFRVMWDKTDLTLPLKITISSITVVHFWNCSNDEQFKYGFQLALKKIWNVHECVHCNMCVFEDSQMCKNCRLLACVTYNETECIVCKESIHPIIFRCETCHDSQICVLCEIKSGNKKKCHLCRKFHSIKHTLTNFQRH